MLLCYFTDTRTPDLSAELYLIPDKNEPLATPVRVNTLRPTTAGIHRLSSDETFTALPDPEDGVLIITPVDPTALYLTPNLNARPGFRVRKIKVILDELNRERTLYLRDRGNWEEWRTDEIRS